MPPTNRCVLPSAWLVAVLVGGACSSDGDAATIGGGIGGEESESTEGGSTGAATTTVAEPGSTGEPMEPSPWRCPTDPASGPAPDPWFTLGWDYKDGWIDLERGGPITITVGGQGAWMVPLGVRGDGFCVPADPYAYDLVPTLDVSIEAEGHAQPVAAVVGFPVSFQPRDEGGLYYTFIPMIIADDLDVYDLDGVPTTITAQLRPRDVMPLSFQLDGVLVMSD